MHPATAQSHARSATKPKRYNPRHPKRTLLYRTVAEHFETWHALASAGQFDGQGDHHTPRAFVRQAFHEYLECGIFAHGFARARCDDCGHDYFVAYFLQGPWRLPLVQHPSHGGDGGAPDGPRSPAPAVALGVPQWTQAVLDAKFDTHLIEAVLASDLLPFALYDCSPAPARFSLG